MKHYIFSLFFVIGALLFTTVTKAQSAPKPPKWMSHKGYWVIESNIKTPKKATVYFYNNNHKLVHKENIDGKRLNTNRRAVCKRLEAILVQSVNG